MSGYSEIAPYDYKMRGCIFDAYVHRGSSGGPIINCDGEVVGVVDAMPTPAFCNLEGYSEDLRRPYEDIVRSLRVSPGVAFAIDPVRVGVLRATFDEQITKKTHRCFEQFAPKNVEVEKAAFVRLQVAAVSGRKSIKTSPNGPFSWDDEGQVFYGWSNDSAKVRLKVPKVWSRILEGARGPGYGGSFILRGYDLLLYSKKYKGYTVNRTFTLVQRASGTERRTAR